MNDDRACIDCGTGIMDRHSNAKRCTDCGFKEDRRIQRAAEARRAERRPPRLPVFRMSLSQEERRYLAIHATYAAHEQDDLRYWDTDPTTRAETKRRWQKIADTLYPDPWEGITP